MSLRLPAFLMLLLCVACAPAGWQTDLQLDITAPLVVARGRVYLVGTRFEVTRLLQARQLSDGLDAWQLELQGDADCTFLTASDDAVVLGCGSVARGIDPMTGRILWTLQLEAPIARLDLQGMQVLVQTRGPSDQLLQVLDSRTGQGILQLQLPLESAAALSPSRLLVSQEKRLEGYDATTGARLWTTALAGPVSRIQISTAGAVLTADDQLVGVALDDGTLSWKHPVDQAVLPQLLDTLLCYQADGAITALDVQTGTEKWQTSITGMDAPPLLQHDAVYVTSSSGTLHALAAADGLTMWTMRLGPGLHSLTRGEALLGLAQQHQAFGIDVIGQKKGKAIPLGRPRTGQNGPVPMAVDGDRLLVVDYYGRLILTPAHR